MGLSTTVKVGFRLMMVVAILILSSPTMCSTNLRFKDSTCQHKDQPSMDWAPGSSSRMPCHLPIGGLAAPRPRQKGLYLTTIALLMTIVFARSEPCQKRSAGHQQSKGGALRSELGPKRPASRRRGMTVMGGALSSVREQVL